VGGAFLVVTSFGPLRRPRLANRLAPYLDSPSRRPGPGGALAAGVSGIFGEPTLRAARRAVTWVGDQTDLRRRLARAGREDGWDGYVTERTTWGLVGAGAAAMGVLIFVATGGAAPMPVLGVIVAALAPAGVVLCDRRLEQAARQRVRRVKQELPAAVDLLALAVIAGESLAVALQRVAAETRGPLGEELRRVVREAAAGTPLRDGLSAMAARLDVAEVRRFVDALVIAQERGLPLADSLSALAQDVREGMRREVLEVAGRRQVYMLMPVIGLILPAALLFAFFPAFVSLQRLVG
jgi:tight adherence protein C